MASTMDAIRSFAISIQRQALGTTTRIMGGSQLRTFDGGEAVWREAVYTGYGGLAQLEFSYDDSIVSKEID